MGHNELAFSIITLIIWRGSPLTKGRCFSLPPIILHKDAYCTCATEYVMRYKLVPRYIFGSISIYIYIYNMHVCKELWEE